MRNLRIIAVLGMLCALTIVASSGAMAAGGEDYEEHQDSLWNNFGIIAIVSFGLFSLLAGGFTAYFGAGKSRAIGGALLGVGLLIFILFLLLSMGKMESPLGLLDWDAFEVKKAAMIVLGALVGAVVAIGLFLVAIMKS